MSAPLSFRDRLLVYTLLVKGRTWHDSAVQLGRHTACYYIRQRIRNQSLQHYC